MASVKIHQVLDAPNDIMWLTGPTLVADTDRFGFSSPVGDYVVVVSGRDFTYDAAGRPTGGVYNSIEMFADPELRTAIAQIYGLESPLATFSANYIDDLAAAGIVADTPAGSFGSDTFVFTSVGSDGVAASAAFDTIEFAAFTPPVAADGFDDVAFHVPADVLDASAFAFSDAFGGSDYGPVIVSAGDGFFD